MKWKYFAVLFFFAPAAQAQVSKTYSCHYQFMQVPFADIVFQWDMTGQPISPVWITAQGQNHTETLTPDTAAVDELLHAWISKEDPQNTLEVFIYAQPQKQGLTRLINPQMPPIAREVWGDCVVQ